MITFDNFILIKHKFLAALKTTDKQCFDGFDWVMQGFDKGVVYILIASCCAIFSYLLNIDF